MYIESLGILGNKNIPASTTIYLFNSIDLIVFTYPYGLSMSICLNSPDSPVLYVDRTISVVFPYLLILLISIITKSKMSLRKYTFNYNIQ